MPKLLRSMTGRMTANEMRAEDRQLADAMLAFAYMDGDREALDRRPDLKMQCDTFPQATRGMSSLEALQWLVSI